MVKLYDNEDNVCGICYNGDTYYFVKNLQGDVVSLVTKVKTEEDEEAKYTVVAHYSYDAWGKCTVVSDSTDVSIATVNPYRYRGYYYDSEIGLYYLQSRYYDAEVSRFINGDDIVFGMIPSGIIGHNIYSYCVNSPVPNIDFFGFWAEKYSGFMWTETGFNLDVQLEFLSREFCLIYASDIIGLKGEKHLWTKKYKKMDKVRIAQELWFHALVYYLCIPMRRILNHFGVTSNIIDSLIKSSEYMQINNDDKRAWVFALAWYYAYFVRTAILSAIGFFPHSYIHI